MKKHNFLILIFSLIWLTKSLLGQNFYYVRFLEIKLTASTDGTAMDEESYLGSLYFGEKIKLLQRHGDRVQVNSLESGRRGWIWQHFITKNHKEIDYFQVRQLIPADAFLISADKEEIKSFSLTILCGVLHASIDNKPIPVKGLVLFFNGSPNTEILNKSFSTQFDKINIDALYIYNGNQFEELIADQVNGFRISRTLPIWTPPELDTKRTEFDGKISLQKALSNDWITVSFAGKGSSSGDAILMEIGRKTNKPLKVYVIPGTILKSNEPNAQDMILSQVKGEMTGDRTYSPSDFIDLSSEEPIKYLLEAYCLNFDKDNPSTTTNFRIGNVDEKLQKILYKGKVWGMPLQVIQAAIWISFENVSTYQLKQRFEINDAEIQKAKELLQSIN